MIGRPGTAVAGDEMSKRYPMRLDPVWRVVLALFVGTPANSYVEIGEHAVRFRFGWPFDQSVPLDQIAGVGRTTWPFLGGIGWRLATRGRIGLIGSLRGVVEVQLRSALRVRLLGIPWRCRAIVVSLEDPDGFVAALRAAAAYSRL
jgi:hypothetical protein